MKFSVLLSVYHKEKPEFLKLSLDSILFQTLVPNEIVLVKDGPLTSELEDVINVYVEKYPHLFKIVLLEKNYGMGVAFNFGLENCTHELVARMDTDDIAVKDRFEKQIKFFTEHPEITILGGAMKEFYNEPNDIERYKFLPLEHNDIVKYSKNRCPFNHPTVMYRKSHVIASGGYKLMEYEDYFLWVRILNANYKAANLKDILNYYRVGNDLIGRRHGFTYAKRELKFCTLALKLGFFNWLNYSKFIFFRLPLRFIPKSLLNYIYNNLLRN